MAEDTGEITLKYVAVNSVEKLSEILKSKCGTSKDFWFGTYKGSEHQELATKLPGLQVGPFWAAEAFTHCYASPSPDADADFASITEQVGLGQRSKKPGRKCGGAGMVYLLLNQNGFSKLYKHNMEMLAKPKPRARSKRDTSKATAGKRARKESSKSSKKRRIPLDAEEILDDAEKLSGKKNRMKVVRDPLATEWPSRPGPAERADTVAGQGHSRRHELHDLHRRQVMVIQKRLEQMLPSLPFEQLSTTLALTKLEESMRKKKGKFDAFRADVERIIIAYVTKKSAAAKAAARHKETTQPTRSRDREQEDAAHVDVHSEEHAGECDPASTATPDMDTHLDAAKLFDQDKEASPNEPSASSPSAIATVHIDVEDAKEVSDDDVDHDVDQWGFQVALTQLRDCAHRPPSDAIAVLMALHAARPTEELLSFGAWEAALGAHERMTSNRRVARLCRRVRERWTKLEKLLKEQKLYRKAMVALEQLKTFSRPGTAARAPATGAADDTRCGENHGGA